MQCTYSNSCVLYRMIINPAFMGAKCSGLIPGYWETQAIVVRRDSELKLSNAKMYLCQNLIKCISG